MMDLDQAKRALEKAAQQLVSQETIEAERDFHKARANLLTVKNDILKQQVHSLLAQRDQLENTLRLGSEKHSEASGFERIGKAAYRVLDELSIPPYGKTMTAKQRAEALFRKDAAE